MSRMVQLAQAFRLEAGSQGSTMSRKAVWLAGLVLVVTLGFPGVAPAAVCTDTWKGPAEGNWQTAADWSTEHVPTSSDIACVGAKETVKVTEGTQQAGVVQVEGTLVVSGGALEVSSALEASAVSKLTVSGGTLTGAGAVKVSGELSWTSGTMSGSGSTVLASSATGSLALTSSSFLDVRSLVNEGTITLSTGQLWLAEGAELKNPGTFDCNSENGIEAGSGTVPTIINTGVFQKTEGIWATGVAPKFENDGTLASGSGTLEFGRGNELVLNEKGVLKGAILVAGASVTGGGFDAHAANITLSAGTFTVGKGTATIGKLSITGGELNGSGRLEVTEELMWSAGTIAGSGTLVVAAGASGSFTPSSSMFLVTHTLLNEGTLSMSSGQLWMSGESKLENTGTLTLNFKYGIATSGSGGTLVNAGVLQKTEGTWPGEIEASLENFGRIIELEGKFIFLKIITSAASTQYGGHNPSAPGQEPSECGDPVDCATGNFSESQTDFAISGLGVGLILTRTYNAQAAAAGSTGVFGHGWSSSFSDHLAVSEGKAALTQANGSTVPFAEGIGEAFVPPAWSQDTLTGNSKTDYTLVLANQVKYQFEGSTGRLLSVSDRNGNQTKLGYAAKGLLETITDPAGRKITLAYNGEGLVESAKDPMGNTVKYAYEEGTLSKVTLPNETKPRWQYHYDGSHQMTSIIDGRGGETTNEYNGSHQVTSQTDPAGHKLKFEYEMFHTKITNNTTGSVTDERFTSDNEPYSITRGFGTSSASTETFIYDAANDLTSVTNGDGDTTKYTFENANMTSMVDPDKDETKWIYNGTHDVIATTTPNGEQTKITRDSHGNAEVVSRPAPGGLTQTTKYAYEPNGNLKSVVDPLKHTWSYEYNGQGDRTGKTDPEGDKRTYTYNEDSQETSMVSPNGNAKGGEPSKYTTKIERDQQGRQLKITDPLAHTTKYTYDGDGNVETVTDGNGHTTTYAYNPDNQKTIVKEPEGNTTETGYDGAGRITSQTDGNKHTTTYTRNPLGEVTEIKDPLGRVTKKEYDAAGNLTVLTDAAGRTTKYSYDPANRLKEIVYSDGTTPTVKYEYDADGNRTKMTDGTGKTSYTYDQLDRLTASTDGHGDSTAYEYDLAGNQTKLTYPNGTLVTRAYDNAGRLQSVTDPSSNTTTFAYNPDSDLTTTTFPKGTGEQDKTAYNNADQQTKITMTGNGLKVLASIEYTRNNDGQIKSTKTAGLPGSESVSDAYDANSRLEKSGSTPYEYDAADNPTKLGSNTSVYDAADELKTSGGTTYGYNPLGERTSATKATLTTTSGYDQAGNLIQVKQGKLTGLNDLYTYNGDGLRMTQANGKTTSHLAWDVHEGLPLILSDEQSTYIYGPTGLPIEAIQSKGAVLYYHHDQQGSTRMLTGATGTIEATSTYDPYGNLTGATGTVTTPLGYDGQYTNTDTGLIYLRARSYDPATAQFLSVDPIVSITQTPYTYSLDNPLNFYDPSGMFLGIPGTPSTSEVVSTVTGAIGSHAGAVLGGIGVGAACLAAPEICVPLTLAATDLTVNSADVHAALNPSEAAELPYTVLQDLAATGVSVLPTTDLGEDAYEAYFGSKGVLEEAQLTALGTSAGIGVAFIPGFGLGTGREEGFECS